MELKDLLKIKEDLVNFKKEEKKQILFKINKKIEELAHRKAEFIEKQDWIDNQIKTNFQKNEQEYTSEEKQTVTDLIEFYDFLENEIKKINSEIDLYNDICISILQ